MSVDGDDNNSKVNDMPRQEEVPDIDEGYSFDVSEETGDEVSLEWAVHYGFSEGDFGKDLFVRADGGVNVLGTSDLTNERKDIVFLKYSSAGVLEKETRIEGDANDHLRGFRFDKNGNAFVSKASYDDIHSEERTSESFLTKYDSDGSEVWKRVTQSMGYVFVNDDGQIFIQVYKIVGETEEDMFAEACVHKFNEEGEFLWEACPGSTRWGDYATGAFGPNGEVFVTGYTKISMDGDEYSGGNDVFVSKLSKNGDVEWTRQMGCEENDSMGGVASDSDGNVYMVAGLYCDFDGTGEEGRLLLTKYDSSGKEIWQKIWGGGVIDLVETDGDGNVYVAGWGNGYNDPGIPIDELEGELRFIAKFNKDGEKLYTQQFEMYSGERMIITDKGEMYITGNCEEVPCFGFENAGWYDIFLAKWDLGSE